MKKVVISLSLVIFYTNFLYSAVLDNMAKSGGDAINDVSSAFGTETEVKDSEIQMDLDVDNAEIGDRSTLNIGVISLKGKATIDNSKIRIKADVNKIDAGDDSQVNIGTIKNH